MGRRGNIVAIAVLVAVVVGAFSAWRLLGVREQAVSVTITDIDGNEYVLPLDTDDTLTITTSAGTNVVVVEDGCVYMLEADCPNQDCVNMGTIDAVGEQIICLPHEVIVEITSDEVESEFDVVGQ